MLPGKVCPGSGRNKKSIKENRTVFWPKSCETIPLTFK
jgi:hypothetical protein